MGPRPGTSASLSTGQRAGGRRHRLETASVDQFQQGQQVSEASRLPQETSDVIHDLLHGKEGRNPRKTTRSGNGNNFFIIFFVILFNFLYNFDLHLQTDLSKVIAKLYNEMNDRKKLKYTEQAKKEKEQFEIKLKKFM